MAPTLLMSGCLWAVCGLSDWLSNLPAATFIATAAAAAMCLEREGGRSGCRHGRDDGAEGANGMDECVSGERGRERGRERGGKTNAFTHLAKMLRG